MMIRSTIAVEEVNMPDKRSEAGNRRRDAAERARRRQRALFIILAVVIILSWVLSLIVRF